MFEESTPSADDPTPAESATADAAPTWHANGTGDETAGPADPTSDITAPDDNTALMLPSTSFGIVSAKLIDAALAPKLRKTSVEVLS